ncbi:MAG TPA: hypothetical protein VFS46_02835 [Nitrososphaera sp.]|nr:hypothetical protein [Nitrososphaera sp.]
MNRGARLAVVAGIVIAIAGGATFMAVSSAPSSGPTPPADNGNSTDSEPRQITVELNESFSIDAK